MRDPDQNQRVVRPECLVVNGRCPNEELQPDELAVAKEQNVWQFARDPGQNQGDVRLDCANKNGRYLSQRVVVNINTDVLSTERSSSTLWYKWKRGIGLVKQQLSKSPRYLAPSTTSPRNPTATTLRKRSKEDKDSPTAAVL